MAHRGSFLSHFDLNGATAWSWVGRPVAEVTSFSGLTPTLIRHCLLNGEGARNRWSRRHLREPPPDRLRRACLKLNTRANGLEAACATGADIQSGRVRAVRSGRITEARAGTQRGTPRAGCASGGQIGKWRAGNRTDSSGRSLQSSPVAWLWAGASLVPRPVPAQAGPSRANAIPALACVAGVGIKGIRSQIDFPAAPPHWLSGLSEPCTEED